MWSAVLPPEILRDTHAWFFISIRAESMLQKLVRNAKIYIFINIIKNTNKTCKEKKKKKEQ